MQLHWHHWSYELKTYFRNASRLFLNGHFGGGQNVCEKHHAKTKKHFNSTKRAFRQQCCHHHLIIAADGGTIVAEKRALCFQSIFLLWSGFFYTRCLFSWNFSTSKSISSPSALHHYIYPVLPGQAVISKRIVKLHGEYENYWGLKIFLDLRLQINLVCELLIPDLPLFKLNFVKKKNETRTQKNSMSQNSHLDTNQAKKKLQNFEMKLLITLSFFLVCYPIL